LFCGFFFLARGIRSVCIPRLVFFFFFFFFKLIITQSTAFLSD
jgi:hypothetical protein